MKPIIDPRKERHLGRKILAFVGEMQHISRDDIARFKVVKRQLARAVADYKLYTGSDNLNPAVDYGYTVI